MKWFNFQAIKNSSIHITPNLPIITTKRYKLGFLRLASYISLYTLAVWMILVLILAVTPLKDFLFVVDNSELKAQTEKIQLLQNRVLILSNQLQSLASSNERIRLAMKLAQKDSVNANDKIYDTLKNRIDKKINLGGNIYYAFIMLINKLLQSHLSTKTIVFIQPAQGIIIQDFNPSIGHMGIDYGVKTGSPVFASVGGMITFSDYTIGSGYMLIIQHDQGFTTVYKHCSSLLKKERDIVSQGDLIALSGNTGKNTSGPHLHFEIWQDGKPIDPQKILLK
jgi:lipoprotein NlpD